MTHAKTVEAFQHLQPIDRLDSEGQHELLSKLEVEQVPKGRKLFVRGQHDPWLFYLVEGRVLLEAPDEADRIIKNRTSAAREPLDTHRPKHWTATALTDAAFIRVDRDLLELLLSTEKLPTYTVAELTASCDDLHERLYYQIVHDYMADKLVIPSMPEVAMRISRATEDPDTDSTKLARLIQLDSGMSARIIQVANSPLYRKDTAISTVRNAIDYLGFELTRNLAVSFMLQQLFRPSSKTISRIVKDLWRNNCRVAALSLILARETRGLNADRAFLVGMLYNIGALPLLTHAEQYPRLAENQPLVMQILEQFTSEISALLLRKWGFGSDMVVGALEANIWHRDPQKWPDYCDVLLIARFHSFIGTPAIKYLPPIFSMPALQKVAAGKLNASGSLSILEEAREEIHDLEKLLMMY
jgi:HD-like signal output (HDOD) protein